jgi:hypothetical protein
VGDRVRADHSADQRDLVLAVHHAPRRGVGAAVCDARGPGANLSGPQHPADPLRRVRGRA